jgi:hypothetical protein
MKDKITDFKQGVTLVIQYTNITYAGIIPTSMSGLNFYFTIEDYEEPKTERITQVNADMSLINNGGNPIATLTIETGTILSAGVLYDCEFTVVDPTYGEHVLDEFNLELRGRVKDI